MARPVPPFAVRLAVIASLLLVALLTLLLVARIVLQWGGCWACGG